jgi:hypothetical protein
VTSQKKVAANKQNALRSTGPRTQEGQRRSSQNALTHGLTAKHFVAIGEDRVEFEELRDYVLRLYPPRDEIERVRVGRLIELLWKVRRARNFETALLGISHPTEAENAKLGIPEGYKIFLPARGKTFEYTDYFATTTRRLWKEITKLEDQLKADRLCHDNIVVIEGHAETDTGLPDAHEEHGGIDARQSVTVAGCMS